LLEAYCGQALFRRQPRPITLTSAGEQLFPVVRDGFGSFVEAINVVRAGGTATRLRLTTTSAFAARWLVPRLPQWRKAHSRLKLEIVSTDEVLSLKNGEADISIRYVRSTPTDGPSFELTRDRGWRSNDAEAPTWRQWEAAARKHHQHVPDLSGLVSLNFREELHAIEAAVSGQGIAICSDLLVAPELASGERL
jgi:LysR family glycine cleavage system transcriptional activator